MMLLNGDVGEDSWESLGLQGDPTRPSKGNQSWIFIGWTDAEAETPILWPSDGKNWLLWKDPDAGKDWRQEETEDETEDETVEWDYWLNGCEFEQAPGFGDGQGKLACWNPWGCKEPDMTERQNWTKLNVTQEAVKKPSLKKEMQEGKVVIWGSFTKSWGKKKSERQGRKGMIYPTECSIQENNKER